MERTDRQGPQRVDEPAWNAPDKAWDRRWDDLGDSNPAGVAERRFVAFGIFVDHRDLGALLYEMVADRQADHARPDNGDRQLSQFRLSARRIGPINCRMDRD